MLINEFGGEFALIKTLADLSPIDHPDLVKSIGDDAAVIKYRSKEYDFVLVTTDMLVENGHFRTDWSMPEQIGKKTVECNVSDIAAMGGLPSFMFVSIALPPKTEVDWIKRIYSGMAKSCRKHGAVIAGGDTTHGDCFTINITLMGTATRESLCLRSSAKAGDLLAVTGCIGGSSAALAMLDQGLSPSSYLMEKHLAPECRLDASKIIAPFAGAMIDISDGLAAEVGHICNQSDTGAIVYENKIPLHREVIKAARMTKNRPSVFALNGGEDFELLFSFSPDNLDFLKEKGVVFHIVGEVTSKENGRFLVTESGSKIPLQGGYNHFK